MLINFHQEAFISRLRSKLVPVLDRSHVPSRSTLTEAWVNLTEGQVNLTEVWMNLIDTWANLTEAWVGSCQT